MSGAASFRGMIEEALLNTHTAFVGKVVQVNGDVADVQPLNMLVTMEGVKKKLPKLEKVPILKSARKFEKKSAVSSSSGEPSHAHTVIQWEPVKPEPGDIVFCVCSDRDISDTKNGDFAVPVKGRHMLSSAVVVGIF